MKHTTQQPFKRKLTGRIDKSRGIPFGTNELNQQFLISAMWRPAICDGKQQHIQIYLS